MRKLFLGALFIVAQILVVTSAANAQFARKGLIDRNAARNVGLERIWHLQVPMNPYASEIKDVYVHVSTQQARWVYEVQQGPKSWFFADDQLDQFGRPVGKKAAEILAANKKAELGDAEILEHGVPTVRIALLTNRGDVTLVDGETGAVLWTKTVGNPRHAAVGVCTNDELTVVLTGLRMYVIRNSDGHVISEKITKGVAGASPVITERRTATTFNYEVNQNGENSYSMIYVPTIENRMDLYDLDKEIKTGGPDALASYPKGLPGFGRGLMQPTLGSKSIAWPTDQGVVYVADLVTNKVDRQLRTLGTITSPVAYIPGVRRFLTASSDGYVYCFKEDDPDDMWRSSIGEPIYREPILVDGNAYVVTRSYKLHQLDLSTGAEKWIVPNVERVISISDNRIYCVQVGGNLMVLDENQGTPLRTVPMQSVDFTFLNTMTDRMYIGTKDGLLQCVRELNQTFPVVHTKASESAVADAAAADANAVDDQPKEDPFAPKPAPMPNAGNANPFGKPANNNNGGGNANPFAPKPAAGNGGGNANPFGQPANGGGNAGGNNANPFGQPANGGAKPGANPFAPPK
ncbi:MAG: PQQ-binding-like beta-propeller repeat protein [Pirellulales bacterium]|nr:PQQ-binding-like beta-propeller repeat protein [Pirellulales bacterium]